jgi:N-terminal domain of anti-restriction factor ArdC
MPYREYEPRPAESSPQEKTRQALQTLETGIDSILSSESFASYLRTMSRFHRYSFGNTVLIHMQRPDATLVAGYRRWHELGRQVQKGARGIKIFVPHKVRPKVEEGDDQTTERQVFVRSFGVGTVFDVSDTAGDPIPEPPAVQEIKTATDGGAALYGLLAAYLEREGIAVMRKPTLPAHGWWEPSSRSIAIGEHLEGDQRTKTLAHEVAHFVAGHELDMPKEDVETIAESAAFVVLSHFDIDTSGYSFGYVARWAKDRAVLKRNLDAIQKTASRVIEGLEALPNSARQDIAS